MSKEEKLISAVGIIDQINNDVEKFGLRLNFVYHCNRCDYLWFPKDFDVMGEKRTFRDIFELIPPKSCARCKSRSWRSPIIRNRNTKLPPPPPGRPPLPDSLNDGMLAKPRIKAVTRNIKRRMAQMENIKKEFEILKTNIRKEIPIPVPVPNKKKKKKLKV